MQTVFEAAGGADGILRLAAAWHERVMADEVVAHAFSQGFRPDHTERLAAYWAEALGGPASYSGGYGTEASVVRLHSGHGLPESIARRSFGSSSATVRYEVPWMTSPKPTSCRPRTIHS